MSFNLRFFAKNRQLFLSKNSILKWDSYFPVSIKRAGRELFSQHYFFKAKINSWYFFDSLMRGKHKKAIKVGNIFSVAENEQNKKR